MKKRVFKTVSLILTAVMLFSCAVISASAYSFDKVSADKYVTYRTGENGISSYYAASEFYEKLTSVPITGDGRTDALAVALSQVGYTEGDSEYGFSGTTNGLSNYTEFNYNAGDYGSGYGGDYSWCASFMSFALYQSRATDHGTWDDMCRQNEGVSGYVWREIGCSRWADQLRTFGMFRYGGAHGGTYIPQYGDLIFFSWDEVAYGEDHIGMVVYSDGQTVWTIEGNTSDKEGLEDNGGGAYFKYYDLDYACISGYGVLPYKTADVEPIDYSGNNPTPGIYMTTSGEKTLYADFDATTTLDYIPQYSMFEVLSVKEDSYGDDMLYVKVELDGETKYGYVVNGSVTNSYTTVIQIYATPDNVALESEVLNIEGDKIKGISPNSTVSELLSSVTRTDSESEIKIYKGSELVANTSKLATGMTVKLLKNGVEEFSYDVVVKGDVNGDAEITGIDYLLIKRHVLGVYLLEDNALLASYIQSEGSVSSVDYLKVKRFVLKTLVF